MKTEPNSQVPPEFARDHLKRSPELRRCAVAAGIEAIKQGEIPLGLKLLRRAWEADHDSKLRLPSFEDIDFRAFNAAAGVRGEPFKDFVRAACVRRVIDTAMHIEYGKSVPPELLNWARGAIGEK